MISRKEARAVVLELFEEEALVIGGLAAVHSMEDDLVWRLMKNLDVLLGKTLRRLDSKEQPEDGEAAPERANTRPHPAIEDFLLKVRRA